MPRACCRESPIEPSVGPQVESMGDRSSTAPAGPRPAVVPYPATWLPPGPAAGPRERPEDRDAGGAVGGRTGQRSRHQNVLDAAPIFEIRGRAGLSIWTDILSFWDWPYEHAASCRVSPNWATPP